MKRRYWAEFVGTFGIVFAPIAFAATSKGAGDLASAAWVSGLAVLAFVYALGPICAAHFNPAVTLGFCVAGRFPWRFAPGYVAAQLGGATLAAGLVIVLFGPGFGTHVPTVSPARAVTLEAVLTFFLMTVIMAVATDKRVNNAIPGLAIGLTVVFDVLIGGAATGGSMNPARSFGPAIWAGGAAWASWWIYSVGPAVGAVLAARLYESLRLSREHAQGAPNELFAAMQQIRHTP